MNEQAIQEQYQHIVSLLEQKRLKEAQIQLEAFLWNCNDWTLRNRLDGHPLRSATDRRLGGLLSHQLANQTRVHLIPPEFFTPCHATLCAYAVLPAVSSCYPPVQGRLPTRYSPVRHSVIKNFKPK